MKQENVHVGAVVGYRPTGTIMDRRTRRAVITFIGTDYVRVEFDELEFDRTAQPDEQRIVKADADHKLLLDPYVEDKDRAAGIRKDRRDRAKLTAEFGRINANLGSKLTMGRHASRPDTVRIPYDVALRLTKRGARS